MFVLFASEQAASPLVSTLAADCEHKLLGPTGVASTAGDWWFSAGIARDKQIQGTKCT